MSVQWLLDNSYNYIKNTKLNPALEVGTSIKAPVHYVGTLQMQENQAGNLEIVAPEIECTQVTALIGSFTGAVSCASILPSAGVGEDVAVDGNLDLQDYDIKNLNSLTLKSGAGVENQVLALDGNLNLVWKNDSAGDVSQWSTYNAVSDVNLGSNNLNGSKTITGTGAVTGLNFSQIYVREATVIGTLTGTDLITGATSNLLTTLGISAVSLLAGELHVVPYGTKISAITLTSGSVILY